MVISDRNRMPEQEFNAMSPFDQMTYVFQHTDMSNWIKWPFMPLINREVSSDPIGLEGFLWVRDLKNGRFRVWIGNLFMVSAEDDLKYADFDDVFDMVKAGWRVD